MTKSSPLLVILVAIALLASSCRNTSSRYGGPFPRETSRYGTDTGEWRISRSASQVRVGFIP